QPIEHTLLCHRDSLCRQVIERDRAGDVRQDLRHRWCFGRRHWTYSFRVPGEGELRASLASRRGEMRSRAELFAESAALPWARSYKLFRATTRAFLVPKRTNRRLAFGAARTG